MSSKDVTRLVSVIILSTAIFFSVRSFSSTPIRIDNSAERSGITVNGDGKALGIPDMVTINVGVSELAKTTKEAKTKADEKIAQIMDILKKNKVDDKNIKTSDLSFSPEYSWDSGKQTILGQRVRQTLTITLKNITKEDTQVTSIVDAVGEINGIEVNGITFDVEDKKELFSQARKLAIEKAEQKAKEMASLTGVTLLKPISIRDNSTNYMPPMYGLQNFKAESVAMDSGTGSSLPVGQLEVNVDIEVIYEIK